MASPEISQRNPYDGSHSPTLLDYTGPGILPLPHLTQHVQEVSQQTLESETPPEGTPPLNLRTLLEEKDRKLAQQGKVITSLTTTVLEQQEKIKQLQAENAQQHEEIVQLREENAQQRDEISQLKKIVAQLQDENAWLKGINLSQQEEIADLKAENTKLKRKMKKKLAEAAQKAAQQQAKIEQLEAEIGNLREENAKQKNDFMQRLVAFEQRAEEKLKQQLAASEQRAETQHNELRQQLVQASGQQEVLQQQLAQAFNQQEALMQQLTASEQRATAEREALKQQFEQQVAVTRNTEQRRWAPMYFGNFLLRSFDRYAHALSKKRSPVLNAFVRLINCEANDNYVYTTGGAFLRLSDYDDLEQLMHSQDHPYFIAACKVLSEYQPLLQIPGSSSQEKVFNLSHLVASCCDERNEIAHRTTKKQARDVVEILVQKHGTEWKPFMEEITK